MRLLVSPLPGRPAWVEASVRTSVHKTGMWFAWTAGSWLCGSVQASRSTDRPVLAAVLVSCRRRAVLLQQQQQQQAVGLPERVMISAGRSRQRDHISGLLRDSTQALLASWSSPFAFAANTDSSPSASSNGNGNGSSNSSSSNSSKLEAAGSKVTEWLLGEGMQQVLSGFLRQAGRGKGSSGGSAASITNSIAADLETEGELDKRCQEAFAAVKEFENNHCLSVQSMGTAYMAARPALVSALLGLQDKLSLRDDLVHDAVLLVDRAMSGSFEVGAGANRA